MAPKFCFRRRFHHLNCLVLLLLLYVFVRLIEDDEDEKEEWDLQSNLTLWKGCRNQKEVGSYSICSETSVHAHINNVQLISLEWENNEFEEELVYEFNDVSVVKVDESQLVKALSRLPLVGDFVWMQRQCIAIDDATANNRQHYRMLKLGGFNGRKLKTKLIVMLHQQNILQRFEQLFIHFQKGVNWRVIIELLKAAHFQPFSVRRIGDCPESSCTFTTSWMRVDHVMEQLDEEINPLDPNYDFRAKLETLLQTTSIACSRKVIVPASLNSQQASFSQMVNNWPVCLDQLQPPCLVYSAKFGTPKMVTLHDRLGGSELFESIMARLGCNVYIFDPTSSVTMMDDHVHKMNWTLGAINAQLISGLESPDSFLYMKASDVLKKLDHQHHTIDILRLDLHGGEWDVIDNIIDTKQAMNYQQLLLSIHLWFGEDRFHLLDRLLRFKKLLAANFHIFHSERLSNCHYVVALLNSNFFLTS